MPLYPVFNFTFTTVMQPQFQLICNAVKHKGWDNT